MGTAPSSSVWGTVALLLFLNLRLLVMLKSEEARGSSVVTLTHLLEGATFFPVAVNSEQLCSSSLVASLQWHLEVPGRVLTYLC